MSLIAWLFYRICPQRVVISDPWANERFQERQRTMLEKLPVLPKE
jgi:hypothetical protein